MTAKTKVKTFSVSIRGTVDFNINIKAPTLEDALAQARAMKQYDWLDAQVDSYNDYELAIAGIYTND